MIDSWTLWGVAVSAALLAAAVSYLVTSQRFAAHRRTLRRELKAANRAAVQANNQMQSVMQAIQASPNGVVVLEPDLRIAWCNQSAAKYLQLDPKRDIAQFVSHLVRSPVLHAYLAGSNHEQELVVDDLAFQLHRYETGALLLVRDIAAQTRADLARRDFVANVSHEIRTPLTVMQGYIQTVQELPLNEAERTSYLSKAMTSGKRLQSLVDDLLTLAKLDEPLSQGLLPVDMADLLRRCEAETRGLIAAQQRKISLQMDVPQGISAQGGSAQGVSAQGVTVMGLESELYSAVINLLTNAIRYTPDGGTVRVSWNAGTLAISDTGLGIAPEHLNRLTERFYRVDKSRSAQTGGTGLGLAIVKHVALRHDAKLQIESSLGQGSTFRLIFTSLASKTM